jgi:hypothetical protein
MKFKYGNMVRVVEAGSFYEGQLGVTVRYWPLFPGVGEGYDVRLLDGNVIFFKPADLAFASSLPEVIPHAE